MVAMPFGRTPVTFLLVINSSDVGTTDQKPIIHIVVEARSLIFAISGSGVRVESRNLIKYMRFSIGDH
jgi:hypothetical protein